MKEPKTIEIVANDESKKQREKDENLIVFFVFFV